LVDLTLHVDATVHFVDLAQLDRGPQQGKLRLLGVTRVQRRLCLTQGVLHVLPGRDGFGAIGPQDLGDRPQRTVRGGVP
jgi:hypothetical protein